MRTMFIECKDRRTAVRRAPWAAVIIKVDGGYVAFLSAQDAELYRKQK